MTEISPTNARLCPFCDYDLRAQIQAARQRGVDNVVCSECGRPLRISDLEDYRLPSERCAAIAVPFVVGIDLLSPLRPAAHARRWRAKSVTSKSRALGILLVALVWYGVVGAGFGVCFVFGGANLQEGFVGYGRPGLDNPATWRTFCAQLESMRVLVAIGLFASGLMVAMATTSVVIRESLRGWCHPGAADWTHTARRIVLGGFPLACGFVLFSASTVLASLRQPPMLEFIDYFEANPQLILLAVIVIWLLCWYGACGRVDCGSSPREGWARYAVACLLGFLGGTAWLLIGSMIAFGRCSLVFDNLSGLP